MSTVKKCALVDVVERHRQYPDTFQIPSEADRSTLVPGDLAKLFLAGRERAWVRVLLAERSEHKVTYRGTLCGEPAEVDLHVGDVVAFGPEHVGEIARDS